MAGRFGKYGDIKRRQAWQRDRQEKARWAKTSSMDRRCRRRIIPSARLALHPEAHKTHKTAVVIIPPADLWPAIQALRQQYDRHFRRWMPHITLLYPFRPITAFAGVTPILSQACRLQAPFRVRLQRFGFFTHPRGRSTFYLMPEPAAAVKALHQALRDKVPDCSDVAQFAGGFTPHLSLGQTHSRDVEAFCRRWQATWRPIAFTLEQVHMIWRNDPPDDIFRMGPALPLGWQSTFG